MKLGDATTSLRQKRADVVYQRLLRWVQMGLIVFSIVMSASAVLAAPYAAMVMDARTGEVLHARNADTRLHPASLTKMMTLYVAFEAIRRGELTLETKIKISRKAAAEQPSKLGLKSGSRIAFRYLIRGAAVKSANDAATAIAEAVSGSEAAFARRMNRTAKALGMTRTTFKNAHGLTESGHLSTARDMTILGRHLLYDYPQYYNLFSRQSTHAGIKQVSNTNRRLLQNYRGADGIKTGYTRAAGFNLVASAERGNERVIATMFGGSSGAARNARVAELLDMGFKRSPSRVVERKPSLPKYSTAKVKPKIIKVKPTITAVRKSPRPLVRPNQQPSAEMLLALVKDVETNVSAARTEVAETKPETAPQPRPEAVKIAEALINEGQPATDDSEPSAAQKAEEDTGGEVQVARASTAAIITPVKRPKGLLSARLKPAPSTSSEPRVITRASTSGGRHWGITLGKYSNRNLAERVLLKTALQEIETLDEALRKVVNRPQGWEANFVGMTQERAQLACARLSARGVSCETRGPAG